ncbi:MAG TPA: Hsp20/alpha crystallin family protein [Polyangiaceae bacterium]|jgi:HSP20 family molecular chaperone IbpA|nr:Hsp20/alpha crystallin family protein [Polyangiaceae bacterium]
MNTDRNLTKHSQSAPERVEERATVRPRVDVYENREELLLLTDLPGAAKETINVHLDKGQLTIEARRAVGELPATLLVAEHRPLDYRRAFAIPEGIDGAKIDAQFTDGVLRVRLPKSEALKPRRIDVKGE